MLSSIALLVSNKKEPLLAVLFLLDLFLELALALDIGAVPVTMLRHMR